MRPYDLLVAGEINPDLILTDRNLTPTFGQVETLVKEADFTIGSSAVIFACGAARLGLKVAVRGVVGDDLFGDYMLHAMQGRGIDISHVIKDPDQSTGFSVILNRVNDRAILTYLGAIDSLEPDHLPDELLSQSRHLHLTSTFLQTKLRPGVFEIFQRARRLGLSTSLDTNWDPENRWDGVEKILEVANVFFPNAAEGQALTGESDPQRAVAILASSAEIVAMKLGPEGAIARQGDHVCRAPAIRVEVVDTVGAGDTFDAGFIYGYLQGWPLEESLKLGTSCGSLSTRSPGGTAAQPDLHEALAAARPL